MLLFVVSVLTVPALLIYIKCMPCETSCKETTFFLLAAVPAFVVPPPWFDTPIAAAWRGDLDLRRRNTTCLPNWPARVAVPISSRRLIAFSSAWRFNARSWFTVTHKQHIVAGDLTNGLDRISDSRLNDFKEHFFSSIEEIVLQAAMLSWITNQTRFHLPLNSLVTILKKLDQTCQRFADDLYQWERPIKESRPTLSSECDNRLHMGKIAEANASYKRIR